VATRLRQVALVARDLDAAVAALCDVLGVEVCFRDPGVGFFGLHNALMPVGDTFLEVVSPLREGTAAGRHLDRRGGDGGYMAMFQVDDLAAERARVEALGVRVVWQGDGEGISGLHLHPADLGAAIVSLDQPTPPESWGWAGPSWPEHVRTGVVQRIAAVELQSDDPEGLAQRWRRVLGGEAMAGVRVVPAEDGRGEGIGGLDMVATDRNRAGERLDVAGVRVNLV
jgi:catechol 2,3-dioxygenase-like lactoylglutathione lyase family enzyme